MSHASHILPSGVDGGGFQAPTTAFLSHLPAGLPWGKHQDTLDFWWLLRFNSLWPYNWESAGIQWGYHASKRCVPSPREFESTEGRTRSAAVLWIKDYSPSLINIYTHELTKRTVMDAILTLGTPDRKYLSALDLPSNFAVKPDRSNFVFNSWMLNPEC